MSNLEGQFGHIDIYLFDQLLRGGITPAMRVLDAGCGSGRNLVYLLRSGCEVYATDADEGSIVSVRQLAADLAPQLPADNFRVERVERMTFPDAFADVLISSAVLHFAADDEQFGCMVREMWRVLRPGGLLFCRLASDIGMEGRMRRIAGRRFRLPDGSDRYLVDEAMLVDLTRTLGGRLVDPLKTSVVQDQRCMTTWVVHKDANRAPRESAALREMTPADAPVEIVEADLSRPDHQQVVVDLTSAYAADAMGNGKPLPDPVRAALIPGLREQPTVLIFLAYAGGQPIGIATCFRGFSTFAARPLINIHDLAVLPSHRGQGIGRQLLEAVERKARALGCCKVTLEVQEGNRRARGVYEAAGFSQTVYADGAGGALFFSKRL